MGIIQGEGINQQLIGGILGRGKKQSSQKHLSVREVMDGRGLGHID